MLSSFNLLQSYISSFIICSSVLWISHLQIVSGFHSLPQLGHFSFCFILLFFIFFCLIHIAIYKFSVVVDCPTIRTLEYVVSWPPTVRLVIFFSNLGIAVWAKRVDHILSFSLLIASWALDRQAFQSASATTLFGNTLNASSTPRI